MADVLQTHPYTCNSCAVAFKNSDAQRTHMRSDWHRYNLKRKVADLPPVTSDDYNEKVLAAQANTTAAQQQAAYAKACTTCQKTYYSENAYQNHISSQKHKLKALAARSGSGSVRSPGMNGVEEEPVPLEAEEEFENVVAGIQKTTINNDAPSRPQAPPPRPDRAAHPLSPQKTESESDRMELTLSRCLFCNYESPSLKLNVDHMTKIHGLFIPEQSYLTDLDGLLEYLQAKIYQNHECIACHKLKGTTAGVQTHMRDKGHCMIAFEEEEELIEIGQFYDFSTTYSDDEQEMDTDMVDRPAANGGARLNVEDEDWETDSDVSSVDSDELTSVPNDDRTDAYERMKLNRHHSHTVERPHRSVDGFHSHAHHHSNAVFHDEHEMHLPSGRVAGHRNLRKYFRQNLHNYPTPAERLARAQRLIGDRVAEEDEDEDMDETPETGSTNRNRALLRRDEAGMLGATTHQKAEVRKAEQRGRTNVQRAQSRYQAKLEKQANNQKHFRDPLLQ